MRVLALASQKGGSGKTTLSAHLALVAERAGFGPVVLIDIDPQGSLAVWWRERRADKPVLAQTDPTRLDADLEVLRHEGFRLAVIDTPPAVTETVEHAVAAAELVVVPSRPSPLDLRAVGGTVELCAALGKPLVFVVNAAPVGAGITREAAIALSRHGTVAPDPIHARVEFAEAMIDGRTVVETAPAGRGAAEIDALWRFVADRLERNFRRTVFAVPGASTGGASRLAVAGFGRRGVG